MSLNNAAAPSRSDRCLLHDTPFLWVMADLLTYCRGKSWIQDAAERLIRLVLRLLTLVTHPYKHQQNLQGIH